MKRLIWIPLWAALPVAFASQPEEVGREFTAQEYAQHNAALASADHEHPPQLLRGYVPAYPRASLAEGRSGRCVLEFTISASGAVENVSRAREDDAAMCDQAIRALQHWKYSPVMVDGQAVAARFRVPIDFDADTQVAEQGLFEASARERGAGFDLQVEEIGRTDGTSRLRVPGVHARTAAQSRWLTCMYTELAVLRGFAYWDAGYPDENQDLVELQFSGSLAGPADAARDVSARPEARDSDTEGMAGVEEMAAFCLTMVPGGVPGTAP